MARGQGIVDCHFKQNSCSSDKAPQNLEKVTEFVKSFKICILISALKGFGLKLLFLVASLEFAKEGFD